MKLGRPLANRIEGRFDFSDEVTEGVILGVSFPYGTGLWGEWLGLVDNSLDS